MKPKSIFSFILFVIFIGLTGCTFNSAKPEISIVDVKFSGVSLFETSAEFVLRVQNENPYDLSFSGARHNIYLNGINVGKGMVDNDFVVPKLGTITQAVKIHLSNFSLIRNIQKLVEAKDFDYKVESTLFRKGALGLNDVNITESGNFKSRY